METISKTWLPWLLLLSSAVAPSGADIWSDLDLPEEHVPYFFYSNENYRMKCLGDNRCPYKKYIDSIRCWGYEENCTIERRMSMPQCSQRSPLWQRDYNNATEEEIFWVQGDFGYIRQRQDEMAYVCQPKEPEDSSLMCANMTRFCKGRNIYMDFRNLNIKDSTDRSRFREDVFKRGQVGGHCQINRPLLAGMGAHKSALQSWFAELQNFDSLPFRPILDEHCDVIFDKPTFLVKLDAGINLYHHYCDFINFYASNHMNNTFHTDVQVIMWDTTELTYPEIFGETWQAFTKHPIIPLKDFDGQRVCFRDVVFPLLARMRRGLYYNTPLIPHCEGSSFFRAFSHHLIHRLNISQDGPLKDKIRITFQARMTRFRKILNLDDLVDALNQVPEYEVKVIDYNIRDLPFLDQVQISHNSDVFMGMHGAGLTHMLFQPDWGSIYEIYNCEDVKCYRDLARLRGLHYLTWDDEEDDKAVMEVPRPEGHRRGIDTHAKFTNYNLDVEVFMRQVREAVQHVRQHSSYRQAWKLRHGRDRKNDEL